MFTSRFYYLDAGDKQYFIINSISLTFTGTESFGFTNNFFCKSLFTEENALFWQSILLEKGIRTAIAKMT